MTGVSPTADEIAAARLALHAFQQYDAEDPVAQRLTGLLERVSSCQPAGCDQDLEISRLREENRTLKESIRRLADQDATLSVCDGNVTVTMDATLTDEEREAVEYFSAWCIGQSDRLRRHGATLRSLLERTK